jgi:hypothetical protein
MRDYGEVNYMKTLAPFYSVKYENTCDYRAPR